MTWEVAWTKGAVSYVVALPETELPSGRPSTGTSSMLSACVALLEQGKCVQITRSDWTPSARRARWESEFYDVTKNGAKRRRYKKTPLEKEWEEFFASQKKRKREGHKLLKDGNAECRECGAKWSMKADAYGLRHICGQGLVQEGNDEVDP